MNAVVEWISMAPSGLWPLMIFCGVWSGLFDAHVSRQLNRYMESRMLGVVGCTYVLMGIVLWIASQVTG